MEAVKDKLWVWGQSPDTHYVTSNGFRMPGHSIMTAREGCAYLGVRNCVRIRSQGKPVPPFDQGSLALDTLDRVVWSIAGTYDLPVPEYYTVDEVARNAKTHSNIIGGILDDFFAPEQFEHLTSIRLHDLKARLSDGAGRALELWTVCYPGIHDDNHDYITRLREFDAYVLWIGESSTPQNIDEVLERYFVFAEGKPIRAVCNLWNFGSRKPMDISVLQEQCNHLLNYATSNKLDGIIFCSNAVMDLQLESVDFVRKWIAVL